MLSANDVKALSARPQRARKPVNKLTYPSRSAVQDDDDDTASDNEEEQEKQESDEDQEEEDAEEKVTVAMRPKKPRSATRKAPAHEATDIWLYDAFFASGSNIKMLVTDWLEIWNSNKNKGMLDLVDLLLMTSDVKEKVDDETLFDSDLITTLIKEIETPQESDISYLLIRKANKTFRKNFCEFFRLLGLMSTDLLLAEGQTFPLINWLSALSSSSYRPFRHAASIVGMTFLSGIAASVQEIVEEHASLSQKITSTTPKTTVSRVNSLKAKKIALESFMNDIYTIIFVHRYRDSDHLIRQDCLSILANCIENCPEVFLESSQLRYLGWALSDGSPATRLVALSSMNQVCKPAFSAGLRPFIERFKQRLIDMALLDKDTNVRFESIKLLVATYQMGFLEDEDLNKFIHLVMNQDEKVRGLVAPVVAEWIKQEFTDPLQETVDEDSRYLSLASEKLVQIKSVAQGLTFIVNRWHSKQDDGRKAEYSEEMQRIAAFNSSNNHFPIRKDEEFFAAVSFEVRHISNWINRYNQAFDSAHVFGFENIYHAVSALIGEFDVLENFEAVCDMLLTDFSAVELSPFTLSDEEESCLVFALSAGIRLAVEKERKSKSLSAKSASSVANRCLIKYLSRLLGKYSKEYGGMGLLRLQELVALCELVDMSGFVDLRLTAAFESILSEFQEIFKTHQDFSLLLETSRRFNIFAGIDENSAPNKNPEDNDDDASLDGSTSLVNLHASGSRSVEELADGLIGSFSESLQAVKDLLEDEEEGSSESTFTEFSTLVSCTVRLHALAQGCNFFSLTAPSEQKFSCFAAMNQCLEVALHALKSHSGSESEVAVKFVAKANILLNACVGTLSIEVNHLIKQSVENASQEEQVVELAEKCKRFYDICEAIATDATGSIFQVKFSLPARFSCMLALVAYYKSISGLSSKISSLARTPTFSFKEQCWAILFQLVHISVFEMPKPVYGIKFSLSSVRHFEDSIWAAFSDCISLVGISLADDFGCQFASNALALTGFSNHSTSLFALFASSAEQPKTGPSNFLSPGILGDVWDNFSEQMIKSVLGSCAKIISTMADLNIPDALQLFRNYLDNVFVMMLDSVQKSIDMYLQRQAGDLLHGEKLVTLFTQQLKAWPKQFESIKSGTAEGKQFIQEAYSALRLSIMSFLSKGFQQLGNRVHEWTILRDEVEDLELSFQTLPDNSLFRKADPEVWKGATTIVGSMEQVNSAWRLWGAIGASFSKILEVLETRGASGDGDQDLESIDDLIENLGNYLAGIDIKPVEGDNTWSAYFAAMDQLRKGATGIKKTATTRKVAPRTRAARSTRVSKKKASVPLIAAGGRKRSSRRLSKLAPILEDAIEEEEEEEEEQEAVVVEHVSVEQEDRSESPEPVLKRDRDESEDEFPSSPEMGATSKRLRR